jgi:hypothetical protein
MWEGDILALLARVAHWIYNDGDSQLVLVSFLDTSNQVNQLEENAAQLKNNYNGQVQIHGSLISALQVE